MNWQVKDIKKKQSEEKTYKTGASPLFYIHRFLKGMYLFVVVRCCNGSLRNADAFLDSTIATATHLFIFIF